MKFLFIQKLALNVLLACNVALLFSCGDSSSANDDESENLSSSSFVQEEPVGSSESQSGTEEGGASSESNVAGDEAVSSNSVSSVVRVPAVPPCRTDREDNCEYGAVVDARDGRMYRTVKIGTQVWLAQNMRYGAPKSAETKDSLGTCYKNQAWYCNRYGRLYSWEEAVQVCPDGWRLPDSLDFATLVASVGGVDSAGKKLKSTKYWEDYEGYDSGTGARVERSGNGADQYGFTVLPAGFKSSSSNDVVSIGVYAYFWTTLEYKDGYMRNFSFANNSVRPYVATDGKKEGELRSVRCLRNEGAAVSEEPKVGCENCEYGSLTDERDGQTYKTVKIGNHWWMAENLNYRYIQEMDGDRGEDSSSYCLHNDPSYCEKWGRLYSISGALDSVGRFSSSGLGCGSLVKCENLPSKNVRGVCPENWHLPSYEEMNELLDAAGPHMKSAINLRSAYEWENYNAGLDILGFSARPAGIKLSDYSKYTGENTIAYFWTSQRTAGGQNVCMHISDGHPYVWSSIDSGFREAYSVRCVMNETP